MDLKAACDSVPREKLVKVLAKKLRKITVEMVKTMLQEMKSRTSGYISKTEGTVERDV